EQAADHIVYYFDDPASPYPAVLTIFPEVYKLTYALLDVWNGTGRLPEVNAAMLRLQDTFDEACAAYRPAARAFGAKYAGEPILYSIAAGLDACVGYVLTNCLVMESLWKHSSPLHAGEFFHGAFEAVDDTAAVFALLVWGQNAGPGGTRGEVFTAQDREADGAGRGRAGSRGLSRLAACAGLRTGAQPSGRAVLRRDVLCDGTPYFLAPVHGGGKILMKLLGIGDNVLDDYRWRQELYPGGNSVNVPVLARRYDGSTAAYIGVLADDGAGLHFASALREEGVDISRVRVMHGISARNYIELDEAGDRHFVGNNGRETAQYQALLCLTPGDYAMMEQYDLAHTSIHSWLDAYHPAISRRVPLSGLFRRVRPGEHRPALPAAAVLFGGAASRKRCGRWPALRWTPERARSW
ncbi:MAG: PfkB family carbohydrate kinase, partial [Ruthenibacterium lactatiformans]